MSTRTYVSIACMHFLNLHNSLQKRGSHTLTIAQYRAILGLALLNRWTLGNSNVGVANPEVGGLQKTVS